MILLHDKKIAIMTPPKCGTNTLHAALRAPPWNGETYVGTSPTEEGTIDRHVRQWPNEAKRYTKLVAVRHPLPRFVSLYLHYCVRRAGKGLDAPAFALFVRQVTAGEIVEPLYSWNLVKWLESAPFDGLLKLESLKADLLTAGIELKSLPALNPSYRSQASVEFYTADLLAMIDPWARPDLDRFAY